MLQCLPVTGHTVGSIISMPPHMLDRVSVSEGGSKLDPLICCSVCPSQGIFVTFVQNHIAYSA